MENQVIIKMITVHLLGSQSTAVIYISIYYSLDQSGGQTDRPSYYLFIGYIEEAN